MRADPNLKPKQAFWETPRNLFIICGAFAAIVATVASLATARFVQIASQPQVIILQQPAPAPVPAPTAN